MGDKFGWQKAARKDAAKRAKRDMAFGSARARRTTRGKSNRPAGSAKPPRLAKYRIGRGPVVKLPAILPAGSQVTIARDGDKRAPRVRHVTRRDIVIDDTLPPISATTVAARYCGFVIFMQASQLQPLGGGARE